MAVKETGPCANHCCHFDWANKLHPRAAQNPRRDRWIDLTGALRCPRPSGHRASSGPRQTLPPPWQLRAELPRLEKQSARQRSHLLSAVQRDAIRCSPCSSCARYPHRLSHPVSAGQPDEIHCFLLNRRTLITRLPPTVMTLAKNVLHVLCRCRNQPDRVRPRTHHDEFAWDHLPPGCRGTQGSPAPKGAEAHTKPNAGAKLLPETN